MSFKNMPKETRELTKEEVKCIYLLAADARANKYVSDLALKKGHMGICGVTYIYKGKDGTWITCEGDESSNDPCNIEYFDNVIDACGNVIEKNIWAHQNLSSKDDCIKYFNELLALWSGLVLPDAVLDTFATKWGYTITQDKAENFNDDLTSQTTTVKDYSKRTYCRRKEKN